ncbi:dihydrofolate reductase family protein [Flindersiella endophytica]
MTKVIADLGVSVDGFIAGPNAGTTNPLGDGGPLIHRWVYKTEAFVQNLGLKGKGATGPDNDVVAEATARCGAFVMGRRMFDEGEANWPEDAPFRAPVYVVTSRAREPWVRPGGTTFYFVTDGLDSALSQARAAAGEKDVRISGGADVVRQCLAAGVVDEFQLHVAPLLLGGGTKLFDGSMPGRTELEIAHVVNSPTVTHVSYRVAR